MLSKKAKYGIRALLYLAERRGRGLIQIKEIAATERIPQKFLETILTATTTFDQLAPTPVPAGTAQFAEDFGDAAQGGNYGYVTGTDTHTLMGKGSLDGSGMFWGQQFSGDFILTALQLDATSNGNDSRSGIMVRDSMDDGPMVFLGCNPQGAYSSFVWRTNPNAAPTADPDGDGLNNLCEYAHGTNPNLTSPHPIVASFATFGPDQFLRVTVPKNPLATDITLTVEGSPEISPAIWSASGLVTEQNTATTLVVLDGVPVTGAARRFLKVKVTLNL